MGQMLAHHCQSFVLLCEEETRCVLVVRRLVERGFPFFFVGETKSSYCLPRAVSITWPDYPSPPPPAFVSSLSGQVLTSLGTVDPTLYPYTGGHFGGPVRCCSMRSPHGNCTGLAPSCSGLRHPAPGHPSCGSHGNAMPWRPRPSTETPAMLGNELAQNHHVEASLGATFLASSSLQCFLSRGAQRLSKHTHTRAHTSPPLPAPPPPTTTKHHPPHRRTVKLHGKAVPPGCHSCAMMLGNEKRKTSLETGSGNTLL